MDVETIDSLARYEASPACAENACFLRSIDRRPTVVHNKPVSALRSSGCVLRCVCGCWVVRDLMINWLQTTTMQLRTKTKIELKSHKKKSKKMKDRNCQLKTKWLTKLRNNFLKFSLKTDVGGKIFFSENYDFVPNSVRLPACAKWTPRVSASWSQVHGEGREEEAIRVRGPRATCQMGVLEPQWGGGRGENIEPFTVVWEQKKPSKCTQSVNSIFKKK